MENEKNLFNEMSEDEFLDENVTIPEVNVLDEQELIPGMSQTSWLKNPDVGESIELEIKKVIKRPGKSLKNSSTGAEFETGLKDKNDVRTEFIIESVDGHKFNVQSWGLYFNLFGPKSELTKLATEKGSYEGFKIKITHQFNGKDAMSSVKDIMTLRGFTSEEDAKKHKETVSKAMKDGTIYKVEIIQ